MASTEDVPAGSIVGGPVCTRVAGGALCVSFLPPDLRLCTFDCTYCTFERGERRTGWPSPGAIGAAVACGLRANPAIESIAIAGRGEQTLHPRFGMAMANVLSARQARPRLPIRISTNGTTILRPEVRRALELADERILRLDAGGDRVHRGRLSSPLGAIVATLASLSDFTLESVFVEGRGANTDADSVREWLELLGELRPSHVYVTTIERPPVAAGPLPARPATLEEIAARVRDEAGIGVTSVV